MPHASSARTRTLPARPSLAQLRKQAKEVRLHHLATDHVDAQTRVLRATMLLDAGASLNRRDPLLRSTPLGWACRWGRVDLVQLYLARGADAEEPEAEAWARPAAWAAKRGHPEILELLRANGRGD